MSIEQIVAKKVIGEGPDLVLLHGWGVNSAVWQPIIENLSAHYRLHLIDLPGFGDSRKLQDYSLDNVIEQLLPAIPDQAILCGWSLGGLIATQIATLYPEKIGKLIQVCASPKFVAEQNWPGVESKVFDNFQLGLQKNSEKTLSRFIAIQAMGCESAKQDTLLIKGLLREQPTADLAALVAGLDLLNKQDLRHQLQNVTVPCLAIFAEFDTLVPLQTAQQVQGLLPNIQVAVIKDSAHAPFISKPSEFCKTMINFIGG